MELAAIILSILSLLLAIISFIVSFKSQCLQNRVNEIELKLKQYELDAKEKEQQKVPLVEARIIHITNNKYKIKVWNSGNGIAKSVSVFWEPKDGIIFLDGNKLPFEILEPQKSFELTIHTYNGAPGKLNITTEWEDEAGEKHTKIQWCDM